MLEEKSAVKSFTLSARAELRLESPDLLINLKSNVNGEKTMIRQILESNLRHGITAAGAWLAAQGYMLELDQQLVGGIATVLAGLLLGVFQKFRK